MKAKENRKLVVGFAFGTPADTFANTVLWNCIWDRCKQHGVNGSVYVFTQPDLGELLPLTATVRVQMIQEENGKPSPTLRIAREAVAFALKFHVTEIHIVAAKPHVWRCLRDLKKAMEEAEMNLPVVVEKFDTIGWFKWFSPTSIQPRTKSPWVWLRREVILWLMPWEIYKRIAG